MPARLAHRLSAFDAQFLYIERPNSPLHIGSLGVYEGRIPRDRFAAHIDARLPSIPRYRQRVATVPFNLSHPTWEDDPDFNIRNHIKAVSLAPPGDDAQLAELAGDLFSRPLDRKKPLWEVFVIDGLESGHTGILSKVHHCMVDGVSGIELLMATVDITPNPAPPPESEPWEPKRFPDPAARLIDAFWDQLGQQNDWLGQCRQNLAGPRERLRQTEEVLRALNRAWPWLTLPAPRTPFAVELSRERRVAFSEMSFAEVRGIRTALGGTVNDVVLTILAGTLGRYLALNDTNVAGLELRVAVPVNVRLEDAQGALGNRVSSMFVRLPLDISDPTGRLNAIREQLDTLKQENQAGSVERLMRLGELAPAPLHALAALSPANTIVNMICTNVPGPMIPLYTLGHLMLAHYPMVPLGLNMGIAAGITSYNQRLYFGLMVDPHAVPDVERLRRCLDESFLELRSAAGVDPTDLPAMNGLTGSAEIPVRQGTS